MQTGNPVAGMQARVDSAKEEMEDAIIRCEQAKVCPHFVKLYFTSDTYTTLHAVTLCRGCTNNCRTSHTHTYVDVCMCFYMIACMYVCIVYMYVMSILYMYACTYMCVCRVQRLFNYFSYVAALR